MAKLRRERNEKRKESRRSSKPNIKKEEALTDSGDGNDADPDDNIPLKSLIPIKTNVFFPFLSFFLSLFFFNFFFLF